MQALEAAGSFCRRPPPPTPSSTLTFNVSVISLGAGTQLSSWLVVNSSTVRPWPLFGSSQ